jgi:hypothetical protein
MPASGEGRQSRCRREAVFAEKPLLERSVYMAGDAGRVDVNPSFGKISDLRLLCSAILDGWSAIAHHSGGT